MRLENLKVEDLMSTMLITMMASETLGDADVEMKSAGIRHIVVVDDRGRLNGILSNRDFYRALAAGEGKVTVAQVMTRRVRTIRPDAPAHAAAEVMVEEKIGALPVVGENGELVGIVTETDFLRVAHAALLGLPYHR